MRSPTRLVSERGAGTVVALALIAVIVSIALLILNVTNRSAQQVLLNVETDNAAVAAADALRGLVAGYPCDLARQLAPVTNCELLESDVLIKTARDGLTAKARAGEPG